MNADSKDDYSLGQDVGAVASDKSHRNTVVVSVRVPTEDFARLERISMETGKSISQVVRQAVASYTRPDSAPHQPTALQMPMLISEDRVDEAEAERATIDSRAIAAERLFAKERQERLNAERAASVFKQQALAKEQGRIMQLSETQPLIKAIVTGMLNFYFEPLPSYAGEGVSSAVENIASCFSALHWYGSEFRRVHRLEQADLTVSWVRDYGSHVLGEAIFSAHIKVGLGTTNCVGEWMAFDGNTIKKILWHELGHSVGYGHSSDPSNIMYEYTKTQFVVERQISKVIPEEWHLPVSLCGAGKYYYSFETEDPTKGFDIFVLPPGVDPKAVLDDGGRAYKGYSKRGMHRHSNTCNVAAGAKILIHNPNPRDAIHLKGTIINRNDVPWPDMTWDRGAFRYDDAQLRAYYRGVTHLEAISSPMDWPAD